MANMIFKFVSLFFIYIVLVRSEYQPGLRIGISDEAVLAFERHYATDFLKNLTDISINGPYYELNDPFYGKFELNISNVKMNIPNPDFNALTVIFNNNNIIGKMLLDRIEISFDFRLKTEFYGKTSKGNVILSKVELTINESLYSLKNNHSTAERNIYGPGLRIESIELNEFDFEVKFEGDSTLENLIILVVKSFRKDIKETVKSTYSLNIRNN